ncbi:MAG TPA: hypothetical protein DD000_18515, partial [Cyanobacteria bacterium UBA11166]|nr:hypothetical protein [Cyanobacteria bacterium UBA11166]
INAHNRITFTICIAALFGSTVVGILTANWIAKPILNLNTAAKAIARGECHKKVEITRSDEIGELAKSFNLMAEKLQEHLTKLQSLNQDLSQSESKLKQFIEAIPVGISIHDPTGKVVYFNEMAKDLLGIEDIPDTTTESLAEVYQLYRENQLYPVEELPALRALRGEKVFIDDIQLHRHNLIIPFEVHGTPIFDKEGKINYAIIAFTDITKRKKYEKLLADYNRTLAERIAQKTADLEESKQQLSRLIDNLPGYVYRVTNDRNYTPQFISEGAFLVTGYRQEEYLIDRTISCAQEIHPADREIVWEIIQKAVAARDYYECEYRIITKSGSEKWLWERGCGIYNETGEVLLLEGFVTDITDRKIAEEKLLETQRIAHIGSWEYDIATQTTTWSKEIYQIHGIDPNQKPPTLDELIQRFHPEDRERYIKLIYEKAIEGQPFEADLRIIRNDGSIRHIEARGESAFNDKGELIRLFGTILDISDRKEIEEKLRYSETRLNTIVTNTSDGILIVDTEGKISFANPAATHLFNLPLDKLIDYHWGIPLQNTSEIDLIDFNSRKIRTAEIKLTQIQWMGDSAYLVTLRDITESKQRDKEIRQLSTALENAVEGISQLDKEGRYITVNKAYADITGYKPEEMIGMEWPITVHPEDRAKMIAAYQEMLAVGKVEAQARGIRKDGCIFYKQLVMVTAYDEEENFIGHYCFMKDITHAYQEAIQRQQAEEALRQSEQRFREIAENISQLFFVKSAISGQFIYISPAYQKIWGRTCESLYQNPQLWIEALHPEDREFVEASLKQQFTGNSVQREYRIIRPDGEVRWVFADISAIRDETGKPLRFIGIAEDISDRKQAQVELAQAKEAAEAANLAKSTFLANMSHELRTPLNGILGYAQIFQKAPNFTLKQKEGVEVIYNCGNHLLTLINDILDLSKIEAGKLELYPEELHFTSFLLNIIQIFILRSKQKEINFNYLTEIPTNTVVYADEKRLRQVLINLLSNAVKFTNTGSVTFKIEVISHAQSVITSAPIANQPILNNQPPITTQTIRFQVEDTGIGMTESQIEKIFLPFEQVGNTSHRSEGSGLGLAITKKILEMMSSQVFVKSTPEIGSIFWFDLDLPILSPSESLTSFKSTHTIIGYSGTKRKILVVDDRWENSAVIRNILESIGFELAEAENGEAGLAKAIEFQPDLIFADLIMPVMDGYEMTRQLRQLPEFQNTIIIAISANAFAVDREKSLASGCQDFIPKPIQAEQLLQKIQDYLKLEWIYQEIEAEEENNMSISEMLIPPMEELATLYEACQLGDTDTVEAEAIRIQKLDPKYNAFTQKILALVADFDCEKITSLVDSLQ